MQKKLCLIYLLLVCLFTKAQPQLMLPIGHTDNVKSIEFSPDKKRILTISDDNTIKIWDIKTGIMLANLYHHNLDHAAFSPDGKKILSYASYSYRGRIAKIWNVETGELIGDMTGHRAGITSAHFSNDSKKIVSSSSDSTARIWDAENGKLLKTLEDHRNVVSNAAFSGDGKKIVTVSWDRTIKTWDTEKGELIATLKNKSYSGIAANFLPDNNSVAAIWLKFNKKENRYHYQLKISGTDKDAEPVDIPQINYPLSSIDISATGEWIILYGFLGGEGRFNLKLKSFIDSDKEEFYSSKVSDDFEKKATLSAKGIKIYNKTGNSFFIDFKNERGIFNPIQISPDNKLIAAIEKDSLNFWDSETGKLITKIRIRGHASPVVASRFSPDGKKIVINCGGTKMIDIETGKLLNYFPGYGIYTEFSPDEKTLFNAGRMGSAISDLKDNEFWINSYSYDILDGTMYTQTTLDSMATAWDVETGKYKKGIKEKFYWITNSVISPDGKKIATITTGRVVKVWDMITKKKLCEIEGNSLSSSDKFTKVMFSNDGKRLITTSRSTELWDAETGKRIGYIGSHFANLSFDKKKIISRGSNFYSLNIVDFETGKRLIDLTTTTRLIEEANFSPDEKKIITVGGYFENSAKVWDVKSQKFLYELNHTSRLSSATFSPDGTKILTSSWDGTCKLWNAENGNLLYSFISIDSTDYLVMDKDNHFDGTEVAKKLLYFTCGSEIIELGQLKNPLWVPNLGSLIMQGKTIDAPKLTELNICGLTPQVDTLAHNSDEYRFKIIPGNGGLGKTTLSINNIETITYQASDMTKTKDGYNLTIPVSTITQRFIAGGENIIAVRSYTTDDQISSKTSTVTHKDTRVPVERPNLYALMVGINDYPNLSEDWQLKFSANDANDLSEIIGSSARKMLNTDGKEHVFIYKLTSAQAGRSYPDKKIILQVLMDSIAKKATSSDIFIFFLAGHGELVNKEFIFLTSETSENKHIGLTTSELIASTKKVIATKRAIILDACHSGQFTDYINRGIDEDPEKDIERLNAESGLFILPAAASDQKAGEYKRFGHGILTYALLKVIKEKPGTFKNGKLYLSNWFTEAKNAVDVVVRDINNEQKQSTTYSRPLKQNAKLFGSGDFFIGPIDDEIIKKVSLDKIKVIFSRTSFQNNADSIRFDDQQISQFINTELQKVSRLPDSKIIYEKEEAFSYAYVLSGRYDVKGDEMIVTVDIIKNNIKQPFSFIRKGYKNNRPAIAKDIVAQIQDWIIREKLIYN